MEPSDSRPLVFYKLDMQFGEGKKKSIDVVQMNGKFYVANIEDSVVESGDRRFEAYSVELKSSPLIDYVLGKKDVPTIKCPLEDVASDNLPEEENSLCDDIISPIV